MRVLLFHNHYQQAGGEDAVAANEHRLLADQGHDVRLATRDNSSITGARARIDAWRNVAWSEEGRRWATAEIESFRPDIVHVHNFFPLISPSVFDAAASLDVPVVLTLHNFRITCASGMLLRDGLPCEKCVAGSPVWGLVHRCYRNSALGSSALVRMISRNRRRGTWQNLVTRFVALSEFSKSKFVQAGLPADRILVKPNFLAADPGLGDGSGDYLLYLGRFGPEKGLPFLMDAWERTRAGGRLLIAGDGPLRKEVQNWADGRDDVDFVGWVDHAQALSYLKAARGLVLPSLCYENQPMTLVEAYATGVPVVGTRHGSLGELIEEGRTGALVNPGDASGLASAMDRVMNGGADWSSWSSGARACFENRFTADRGYQDLMRVYADAAGGEARRS